MDPVEYYIELIFGWTLHRINMLLQFYLLVKNKQLCFPDLCFFMFCTLLCSKLFFYAWLSNLIILRYTWNKTNLLTSFFIFLLWNLFSVSENYRFLTVSASKLLSVLSFCVRVCHILAALWTSIFLLHPISHSPSRNRMAISFLMGQPILNPLNIGDEWIHIGQGIQFLFSQKLI